MKKNDVFETPQEENEHSIKYWLKNHKFVAFLYAVSAITIIAGVVLLINRLIEDFKGTMLLLGGLSPILLLGVAGIFATAKEQIRKRKEKKTE